MCFHKGIYFNNILIKTFYCFIILCFIFFVPLVDTSFNYFVIRTPHIITGYISKVMLLKAWSKLCQNKLIKTNRICIYTHAIFMNFIGVHLLCIVMDFLKSIYSQLHHGFGLIHPHIILFHIHFLLFLPGVSGSCIEKAIYPPVQVFILFI